MLGPLRAEPRGGHGWWLALIAGGLACTPAASSDGADVLVDGCPADPGVSLPTFCPPPLPEGYASCNLEEGTDSPPCAGIGQIQPVSLTADRDARHLFFSVMVLSWYVPRAEETRTFLYRMNLRDFSVTDAGSFQGPLLDASDIQDFMLAQGYSYSRDGDWDGQAVRTPCTVVDGRYAAWLRPSFCSVTGGSTLGETSFGVSPLCWEARGGEGWSVGNIGQLWDVRSNSLVRGITVWFADACGGRGAVSPFPATTRSAVPDCTWPDVAMYYDGDPVHCRCTSDSECPGGPCAGVTEDGIRYCRCPSLAW